MGKLNIIAFLAWGADPHFKTPKTFNLPIIFQILAIASQSLLSNTHHRLLHASMQHGTVTENSAQASYMYNVLLKMFNWLTRLYNILNVQVSDCMLWMI